MSGQQVGTIVGGVIGAYIGGPAGFQIGAAIGGTIGGYVDPTKIVGPRLSDATAVTAQDGIPNPWGFGTFPVGPNILWAQDKPTEHKTEDNGKGSGTVQVTYTYTMSYALGICRGVRLADGTYDPITGILRATKNGKVVYNTAPDATAEEIALNSKFLENHKFYLGDETQLPDPTVESYMGAGNVSAYRGQVYMVATDDETSQGEIAQWEFVVTMDGTSSSADVTIGPLQYGPTNKVWIDGAQDATDPRHPDLTYEYCYGPDYGGTWRATLAEAIADYPLAIINEAELTGWTMDASGMTAPWEVITGWEDRFRLGLVFSRYGGEKKSAFVIVEAAGETNVQCSTYAAPEWGASIVTSSSGTEIRENATIENASTAPAGADAFLSCHDGGTYNGTGAAVFSGFVIHCRPFLQCFDGIPSDALPLPGVPGYWVNSDGTIGGGTTCEVITGTFKQLAVLNTSGYSGGTDIIQLPWGPTVASTDPNYADETFWTDAYDLAVLNNEVPSGWVYSTNYPTSTSSACQCTSIVNNIDRSQFILAVPVAEVCKRSGLVASDYDVSQLTDLIDGFRVATINATGEAIIQSLMPGYFFDVMEADSVVTFVKRGGNTTFDLVVDDLAEREPDVVEEIQTQEVELLKKVHIKTMDPAAGYVVTTQTWERLTSNVAAEGEQTIEVPVVTDHDTQAQIAAKRGKVAWSELRRFKAIVPYIRPDLTVTDVGTLTDRKGRTQRIRMTEMAEDAGRIQFDASLDRQSAYTSNVQGVPALPPANTSPGLIGPTIFWAGNLPSLRTQDNVPGAYIGATGYFPAWIGCVVFMSVDGGTSYQQVTTLSNRTQIGNLTAGITDSGEPIPVFMADGTLSTINADQLAAGQNGFAITSAKISEIGQFETSTSTGVKKYDLTNTLRGLLGTTAVAHNPTNPFVMLDGLKFLPLDISLSGKTLYFKPVSFGTTADDAPIYPFVFNPLFTSVIVSPFTDENFGIYTDEDGNIYYNESQS